MPAIMAPEFAYPWRPKTARSADSEKHRQPMRLICPKCQAHYEVDDEAIPSAGRDVQCSSCGHAWYQLPASTSEPEVEIEPEPALEIATRPGRPPTSRKLDPVIAEILREEAEREARARSEGTPDFIEGQTEMAFGAHEPESPPEDLPEPQAGFDSPPETLDPPTPTTEPEPEAEDELAPRRDLLPDIEEINSSLRAHGSLQGTEFLSTEEKRERARRSQGFALGFAMVAVLFCAVMVTYVFAPEMKKSFPVASGGVDQLVAGVDAVRGQIDTSLQGATAFLSGFLGDGQG